MFKKKRAYANKKSYFSDKDCSPASALTSDQMKSGVYAIYGYDGVYDYIIPGVHQPGRVRHFAATGEFYSLCKGRTRCASDPTMRSYLAQFIAIGGQRACHVIGSPFDEQQKVPERLASSSAARPGMFKMVYKGQVIYLDFDYSTAYLMNDRTGQPCSVPKVLTANTSAIPKETIALPSFERYSIFKRQSWWLAYPNLMCAKSVRP